MINTKPIPSVEDYRAAFVAEGSRSYPEVSNYLSRKNLYDIPADRLTQLAGPLACPVKANPPNWQHGRVIYGHLRHLLTYHGKDENIFCLDIGTAKGFSACVMAEAFVDMMWSDRCRKIISVDVIDPEAAVRRNTIVEAQYGFMSLAEIHRHAKIPDYGIEFRQQTGIEAAQSELRWHFVFVDGKHDGAVVAEEIYNVKERQTSGDYIIFDDVHIPSVAAAVAKLRGYWMEELEVLPNRKYAICRHF